MSRGKCAVPNWVCMASTKQTAQRGGQVSVSAFAFLFGQFVCHEKKETRSTEVESSRLFDLGYNVGMRELEAINLALKDFESKRDNTVHFIAKQFWPSVFGYALDYFKVKDKDNQCCVSPPDTET